jgi:hypothetical protein
MTVAVKVAASIEVTTPIAIEAAIEAVVSAHLFGIQNRTAVRIALVEVVDFQRFIFRPGGYFVRKRPVFIFNHG